MRLLASLLRSVLAMTVASTAIGAYAGLTVFPLSEPGLRAFGLSLAIAALLECLAISAATFALGKPLSRALAGSADDAEARLAAAAAQRLPSRLGVTVLAVGCVKTAAIALVLLRVGLPADLTSAGAGIGVASAILAGMLAYSVAAAASARAAEALDSRAEAPTHGTVRGKILVLGFGLNTIGVLLLAPTGYVQHRADVDRDHLAAATRAQAAVVAAVGLADPLRAAAEVQRVTGVPVALVSARGVVLARFGAADLPFERAAVGPAGGAIALDGGWLVSTPVADGAVASWVADGPVEARRRAYWASAATTALVAYLATALLAWAAARAITVPFRTLGRAADRIASGDLTATPPSISHDEMGRLAADFRRMAHGLKALVVDVQAASEGVSLGAHEAGAIGERVRTGALSQHGGVVSVQQAFEAMEGSVAQVSRGVGALAEHVTTTTRAVAEMAAAHEEVRHKGGELERATAAALHDVEHLGAAGREAEGTLGELEALAGHSGGTLAAVRASVAGLERAAADSEATAASVADMALRAGGVVEETVHGIEGLRAAVSDAHRRIAVLGRRSDDIDQVVDFISEVAGRTNLLSLNASIIAAQAGEHGKAFSVVADQIRELASQIARSTTSIGDIIHAVREDVEATAALIDRGDALAAEGVQLARNSLEALSQIQRSTAHGCETAAAIRAAVDAHGRSACDVSALVQSVADGSRSVAQAVQLVGRSVRGVNTVSRTATALADQLARAIEVQGGIGKRQHESLGRLERMISDVARAVESHDAATRRVRDALQTLSVSAGSHEAAVEGLTGVSDQLSARAKTLADRVNRFKV